MHIGPPPLWREGAGTARMPAGPRFPSNLTSATPAPSAQEPLIQPAQLPPTVMKVEIKNCLLLSFYMYTYTTPACDEKCFWIKDVLCQGGVSTLK